MPIARFGRINGRRARFANCRRADPAYGAGVKKALAAGVKTPTPNKVV